MANSRFCIVAFATLLVTLPMKTSYAAEAGTLEGHWTEYPKDGVRYLTLKSPDGDMVTFSPDRSASDTKAKDIPEKMLTKQEPVRVAVRVPAKVFNCLTRKIYLNYADRKSVELENNNICASPQADAEPFVTFISPRKQEGQASSELGAEVAPVSVSQNEGSGQLLKLEQSGWPDAYKEFVRPEPTLPVSPPS